MTPKFRAVVHHKDDMSFVKLSGVIDEDNELTDLADKIHAATVVIDLGEVERINSNGVRDWVNWLARVQERATQIVLVECSPAIVGQINLVNNFIGRGYVKSFYVPYFCAECDEEKAMLVEASELGPGPHEPPTCRCDECDLVMEFDDMADTYFAFLTTQKQIQATEKLQSLIAEMSPDGDRSRIRSMVGTGSIAGSEIASSLPSVPSLPSMGSMGSMSSIDVSISSSSLPSVTPSDSREDDPTTPIPVITPREANARSQSGPPLAAPEPSPMPPSRSAETVVGKGLSGGFKAERRPPPQFSGGRVAQEPPRPTVMIYAIVVVIVLAVGGLIYILSTN
jgi:anti-anti-sigma regulatory factor